MIAIITLSGCTIGDRAPSEPATAPLNASTPGTFDDRDSAESEYAAAAEDLKRTLPEGSSFPADMPGQWDEDAVFEEGVGDVSAALYWRCAWMQEYVKAATAGDGVRKAEALAKLSDWTEIPAVRNHSDEDLVAKWTSRVIEPARGGDDYMLTSLAGRC